MGILKDILAKQFEKTAKETGHEIKFLYTGSYVLETAAQAKYNDIRRVERGYVQGVHDVNQQPR